jgi:cellobiose phosphorylase
VGDGHDEGRLGALHRHGDRSRDRRPVRTQSLERDLRVPRGFRRHGRRQTQWTADRREFLGRHGGLDFPAALRTFTPLSRRTGAGLDPCCAMQTIVALDPGETVEVVFFLGEAASAGDARALIARYRDADLDAVLKEVTDYWDDVLGDP